MEDDEGAEEDQDPVVRAEAKARSWQRQLLQRTSLCDSLEEQLRVSEEVRRHLSDENATLLEEKLKRDGASGAGLVHATESLEKLRTVRRVLALDRASLDEMKREIGIFQMEVTSLLSGGFGPVAAMTRAAAEHTSMLKAARREASAALEAAAAAESMVASANIAEEEAKAETARST